MVTSQTAEIGEAETTLKELRRTAQSLEINLDSMRNMVRSYFTCPNYSWPLTSGGLKPNPDSAQILHLISQIHFT